MTKDMTVQFEKTLETADDLNRSSFRKSSIVLTLYSSIWGLGFLAALFWLFQAQYEKRKVFPESQKNQIKVEPIVHSQEDILRAMNKYLEEIFPSVYQPYSYFTRMLDEILKHHAYIALFTTHPGLEESGDPWKKIITLGHLLTVQAMVLFFLAVFYDIEVLFFSSCLSLLTLI